MPTPTYTPLANITLGSPAASIVFGSIPATYRDLVIVFQGQGSTTLLGRMTLNSDTGANYSYTTMGSTGSAQSGARQLTRTSVFLSRLAQATTTSALQMNINIMDYTATDKHTTIISRADNAANGTEAFINRWGNTAVVTSITILTSTGNWAAGTTAAIYGIVA